MTTVENLQKRVQRLEEKLAHEQHTVQQLNQIVIELREAIEQSEKALKRQQEKIENLEHQISENLPHEKPPHY